MCIHNTYNTTFVVVERFYACTIGFVYEYLSFKASRGTEVWKSNVSDWLLPFWPCHPDNLCQCN